MEEIRCKTCGCAIPDEDLENCGCRCGGYHCLHCHVVEIEGMEIDIWGYGVCPDEVMEDPSKYAKLLQKKMEVQS